MNSKWYLSTLLIVLALFGVSVERVSVPNQEIVLQFGDHEVDVNDAETTIAIVKKQLLEIGVQNIQVGESSDGSLTITYYSDLDVSAIKEVLSKAKKLTKLPFGNYPKQTPTELPFQEDLLAYQLNVFEIQTDTDLEFDYDGNLLELASGNDRYVTPLLYASFKEISLRARNNLEKVAYAVHRNSALLIDNASHNIPEVRAGPLS